MTCALLWQSRKEAPTPDDLHSAKGHLKYKKWLSTVEAFIHMITGGVWWISQYIGLNKALGSSDESMSADFSLFLSRTRSWSLRLSLSL